MFTGKAIGIKAVPDYEIPPKTPFGVVPGLYLEVTSAAKECDRATGPPLRCRRTVPLLRFASRRTVLT